MSKDSGKEVTKMAVDGGMTVNNLMMQIQADFANATIVRKEEQEITGVGVAIAAGLHVKFWDSLEEVEDKIKVEREFTPSADYTEEMRAKKRKRWTQAVERSIGFGWDD
jgi:glycerol kinase